jgi:hypothetical protein
VRVGTAATIKVKPAQELWQHVCTEGGCILALARAAATSKARHRLDQLSGRVATHGCGRRVNGKTAKLPIRADRAQGSRSS